MLDLIFLVLVVYVAVELVVLPILAFQGRASRLRVTVFVLGVLALIVVGIIVFTVDKTLIIST